MKIKINSTLNINAKKNKILQVNKASGKDF